LPAGLTPTANNGSATAGNYAGGTWSINILLNGETETLTLEGTVDAGQEGNTITNTLAGPAESDADDPSTVGDDLTESVVVSDPALSLAKVADVDADLVAGDTVTYTYTAANTGNVTIADVTVSDVHNGTGTLSAISVGTLTNTSGFSSDDGADGNFDFLQPGDSVTFTSTYIVTAADEIAGTVISNTATASGTPSGGTLTDPTATEEISLAASFPPWTPGPGPYSDTTCLATASPTAPLNQSQVTWNLSGSNLQSIDVVGEPTPFTLMITPDSLAYNFLDTSNAANQRVRDNGTFSASLAGDGPAVFNPALLAAANDLDLLHYLQLDVATNPTDYVDFLYNQSIASSGNRYLVMTERFGNNTASAQAIDINGNPIGNAVTAIGNNANYLLTGAVDPNGQNIEAYVYPLTALVPTGTQIHGIRYTQSGATGSDGADGKVFILIDPVAGCDPKLALTKAADDNTNRVVGDTITYTYTVENTGDVIWYGYAQCNHGWYADQHKWQQCR